MPFAHRRRTLAHRVRYKHVPRARRRGRRRSLPVGRAEERRRARGWIRRRNGTRRKHQGCVPFRLFLASGPRLKLILNVFPRHAAAILRIGLLEMSSFTLEFFPSSSPHTFSHHSAGVADLITSMSLPPFCLLSPSRANPADPLTPLRSFIRRSQPQVRRGVHPHRQDVQRTRDRAAQRPEASGNGYRGGDLPLPEGTRPSRWM
jgi:hypothetical protein